MASRKTTKTNNKPVQKEETQADKIWNMIKDLNVDIFALEDQKVNQYCEKFDVEDSTVYVRLKSTAVLPALEEAIKKVKLKGEVFELGEAGPYKTIKLVPTFD
jgi:hypothetical protein